MLRTRLRFDLRCAALVASVATGLGVPAMAQSDGFLCAARNILGRYETPNIAYGIALDGDYAYVAVDGAGLLVVDISDPTAPAFVSSVEVSWDALRVAAGGSHTFVAVGPDGMQVVDVSDPTAPAVVGGLDRDGWVKDVATDGGLLYMADGYGLVVVDVSDPVNPQVVGELTTPGSVSRLCAEGSLVYVWGDWTSVHVVDIANPSDPVLVGSFNPDNKIIDVDAEPGYAYVALDTELIVLDMSDPSQPEPIGSVALPAYTKDDIVADSGRVYVDGGRVVVDVTQPAEPVVIGSCLSVANHAVIRGSLAYTVSDEAVEVVDVSDPPQSGILGNMRSRTMEGVDVSGSYAYVADISRNEGLIVIDITDPAAFERVATVDTGGLTHDVVVQGDYAYVADSYRGLRIIDISDPTQPVMLNEPNEWEGSRLDVEGDIAVVSGSRLYFIDIRDPYEPVLLAEHPGIWGSRRHGHERVESGYAFTAGRGEFRIYDLSHPEDDPIATAQIAGNCLDVDMSQGIACVDDYLDGDYALSIFDISDLTAPEFLGSMKLPEHEGAQSVVILGDKVLLGLQRELWLVDISNPSAPRRVASATAWYGLTGMVWDIAVTEGRAYAVSGSTGLTILDISDCPPCPADFNGDGVIDTRDFIAFLGAWASERGEDCSAGDCSADLTGDGVVDTRDFIEFLSFWTDGC